MNLLFICIYLILGKVIGQPQSINLCQLERFEENMEQIICNARPILIDNEDSCVLNFMSDLTDSFIATKNQKFLVVLDSICLVSDGYISEYFWELNERLVNKSFNSYSSYLSKDSLGSCMEYYLLQRYERDREKLLKEIDEVLDNQATSAHKLYLKRLKNRLL